MTYREDGTVAIANERSVVECTGACCADLALGAEVVDTIAKRYGWREPVATFVVERMLPDSPTGHGACRLFDAATRRCTAYGERPQMCSAYPYGKTCELCGGTGSIVGPPLEPLAR